MKFKFRGKRYEWKPENMHPALLYGGFAMAIMLSVVWWWIVLSVVILEFGG